MYHVMWYLSIVFHKSLDGDREEVSVHVVLFCEKTGMKWGNGTFLKKRWRGGKTWNDTEKKEISNLLGV